MLTTKRRLSTYVIAPRRCIYGEPQEACAHCHSSASETRSRHTTEITVSLVVGALLLVCFGLLLGAAWATQVLHHQHKLLAEERRRLNEQWLAIRAAQRHHRKCDGR